jgi:hypothetical protein
LVAEHDTVSIQQIRSLTLTSAKKYLNRYMLGDLSKHWKYVFKKVISENAIFS